MRRRARILVILATAGLLGCQSGTGSYRRSAAKPEPGLAAADEGGSGFVVNKPPPPPTADWVERHPLFYKPREVYNNSGSNRIVKVAGATIVGVPMGIVGELRQIVVGAPSAPAPAF